MTDGYGLFRPHPTESPFDPTHTAPWQPGAQPPPDPWSSHGQPPPAPVGDTAFTAPDLAVLDGRWSSEEELARLLWATDSQVADPTAAVPPAPPSHPTPFTTRPPSGHRRPRLRRPLPWPQLIGCLIAVVVTLVVAVVSVVSGMVAYSPLYRVAVARVPVELVHWWPLLVYGPWLAGACSVLRAALYGRRAVHAWIAVLFFSVVAVVLCVGSTTLSVVGSTVAGLPPIAALTCFHLLVRQITLTRPLSARRHRRGGPRH